MPLPLVWARNSLRRHTKSTSCRSFIRAMAKTERNYSTYHRELLAIVSAFGTFATTFSAGGLCYVLITNHCNIFPSPETLGVDAPEGLPNYSCMISASSRLKNCVADALSCLGFAKNPLTQLQTSLQVNHRNFWKTTCGLPKQPTLTSR